MCRQHALRRAPPRARGSVGRGDVRPVERVSCPCNGTCVTRPVRPAPCLLAPSCQPSSAPARRRAGAAQPSQSRPPDLLSKVTSATHGTTHPRTRARARAHAGGTRHSYRPRNIPTKSDRAGCSGCAATYVARLPAAARSLTARRPRSCPSPRTSGRRCRSGRTESRGCTCRHPRGS